MKILLVDDKLETVKGIKDYAEEKGWEIKESDFENAVNEVYTFSPDLVVTDWMLDADNLTEGEKILNEIYIKAFRPIIIFSAIASTINLSSTIIDTPLIEIIDKGDEEVVIQKIENWEPYIKAVHNLRVDFNESLLVSVKAIDNFLNMKSYPGDKVIKYMLNKRTTYYFDKEYIGDCLPAWVQYEYPPILKHFVVTDVIRIISEDSKLDEIGNCEEYFIILTPSCDLARAKPTDLILLAQCESKDNYYVDCKLKKDELLSSKDGKQKKDILTRSLNQGYNYAKVPLPELPNKLPYLTINLKKIKQVSVSEIALCEKEIDNNNHKFVRIATISSPYREQIVWAHMINSCRPGMPNREIEEWAEAILT